MGFCFARVRVSPLLLLLLLFLFLFLWYHYLCSSLFLPSSNLCLGFSDILGTRGFVSFFSLQNQKK
ncbi:hypothetical protein PanWU01x14_237570 [Parasponia andersonii]|uniref:Uncharacterized protein n=1 Tax=Parasponia andersonii TaxID=3476 RepID=A0A2P5BHT3_PARAD|nr:hypothetical protein PanWU01x14_237570 [Parasponia andersonii]